MHDQSDAQPRVRADPPASGFLFGSGVAASRSTLTLGVTTTHPHMSPLFKKLNLGAQSVIHVLNAPESFEPELAALKGVTIKRSVSGRCGFAMAFVISQTELDIAS